MNDHLPYPPGTLWEYRNKRSDYRPTSTLALRYELKGSSMSDDYEPGDISARDLWARYVRKYGNLDMRYGFPPGHVHVSWFVSGEDDDDTGHSPFEAAPFQTYPSGELWEGDNEDFLTFFTWPTHAETGERVNFARLRVLDCQWNSTTGDKGGFIQEATGWKPSPLQPVADLHMLARAAQLTPPPAPPE